MSIKRPVSCTGNGTSIVKCCAFSPWTKRCRHHNNRYNVTIIKRMSEKDRPEVCLYYIVTQQMQPCKANDKTSRLYQLYFNQKDINIRLQGSCVLKNFRFDIAACWQAAVGVSSSPKELLQRAATVGKPQKMDKPVQLIWKTIMLAFTVFFSHVPCPCRSL